jgi:pimeloyl-ACP methyl ester carboxylesterase
MEKLTGILLDQTSDITLVGSSFGGLMASIFALDNKARVKKLILLAPAINLMDTSYRKMKTAVPVPGLSWQQDEVIDIQEVQKVAESLFENLRFHVVEDDHFPAQNL